MGVDLGDLCIKKPTNLEALSGKIIAIDAFNILYQFLSSIRQEDGKPLMDNNGKITAHLSGLFYRNIRFLEQGIKVAYVFDGKSSHLKAKTIEKRSERKRTAEQKFKEATTPEEARKYAQATSRLTSEMVIEAKELLTALGIPYVEAPSEGEAEAALLVEKGIANYVGSQDYDSLLFGAKELVRNLSISGRRKVPRSDKYIIVEPEIISLEETLNSLGVNREQLVCLGILVGTDFNDGVLGIGPKKALKIVKEYKDKNAIKEHIKTKFNFELDFFDEILDLFLKPKFQDAKLVWTPPNIDKLENILVKNHDFSLERIEKSISNLEKITKEKNAQSKLDRWF